MYELRQGYVWVSDPSGRLQPVNNDPETLAFYGANGYKLYGNALPPGVTPSPASLQLAQPYLVAAPGGPAAPPGGPVVPGAAPPGGPPGAPPGAIIPGAAPPGGPVSALGPYAEYLATAGLGNQPVFNPFQQYQANLYKPARSFYETLGDLAGGFSAANVKANIPANWTDFLATMQGQGGLGGVHQQGADLLRQIFGMTPTQRGQAGFQFEPQYNSQTGELLEKTAEGSTIQGMGTLQNLVQTGLAGRLPGVASRWAADRLPTLQRMWQQDLMQGGGKSFMDWLKENTGFAV